MYLTGGEAAYEVRNAGYLDNSRRTGGFGGGLFYNFPIESRVIDGRANISPGDRGGYLAGGALRVGFVPHVFPLRPYFQLGAGVVHTSYPYYTPQAVTQRGITSGAAQVAFGLDIRVAEHIDLRAPELLGQAGGNSGLRANVATLQFGVVYHLHPAVRHP